MRTTQPLLFACVTVLAQIAVAADVPPPAAKPPVATTPAPAAAAAAAPVALPAPKPVAKPPVAIVNGVAIDPVQAELVRMDLLQRKRPASDENVRNFLIDNELLSQEAVLRGLDKSPEVKAVLVLQQKDVLAKALIDDFVKNNPIKDERAKAEYDQLKAKTDETEYQPSHILVADEKMAKNLIASLDAKKKTFETLAQQYSKDATGKEGGDLGWLSASNLVPEFASVMVTLKKGEYTKAPVKTQFGWHVIKVKDVRKFEFPEFDKVKGRIVGQMIQQDIRKYLGELRATAKIEIPGQAK